MAVGTGHARPSNCIRKRPYDTNYAVDTTYRKIFRVILAIIVVYRCEWNVTGIEEDYRSLYLLDGDESYKCTLPSLYV